MSNKRLTTVDLNPAIKRKRNDSSVSSDNDTLNNSASTSNSKKSPIKKTIDGANYHQREAASKCINVKRANDFLQFLLTVPDLKRKKGNVNVASLLSDDELKCWPDIDELQRFFRTYYLKSALLKNVPLQFALSRCADFVAEESFVTIHPSYPKAPKNAHSFLCQKLGISMFNPDRSMNADEDVSNEARRDAELDKERFLNDLENFLAAHRETILPVHALYLEKKLKSATKKKSGIDTPNKSKKANTKSGKKERLTAFDFYKQSKKHKFPELSFEEREAKLRRHFERLDEDKRRIFEDLASNEDSD